MTFYFDLAIAMKFNDTIEQLQERITKLIAKMDQKTIKSITGYKLYTDCFIE